MSGSRRASRKASPLLGKFAGRSTRTSSGPAVVSGGAVFVSTGAVGSRRRVVSLVVSVGAPCVSVAGPVVTGGAMEGYLVDKATAEELDITSLEDFKRDEVKAAFDRDGDGKADMVACPPGWGCELTIEHHMNAYDLGDHINLIKAGYPAAMADAVAAYDTGNPILFYTWTPNWTVNELVPGEDVVWIEVPEVNLPEEMAELADAAIREGVEGCVNDPCMLGFPANSIDAVANSAFLDDNPAVRALLESVEIPITDVYAQNAAMNAGDDDIEAQAAAWIEENRALVDEWLAAARAAS